jgi:hypothetical protein
MNMKKQFYLLSIGLIFTGLQSAFSQQNQYYHCYTDEAMEAHFLADPSARARYENSQKEAQKTLLENQNVNIGNKTAGVVYTIPVVFHILHQYGPENVSDQTCIDALALVNRDFARMGSDTNLIFAPFKSRYVDSEIRFVLAKKDPQGNCITGIVRHEDPKTQWDQLGAGQFSAYWGYTWNPTRYLNIYVVANIIPSGPISGGQVGGYTYIPGSWPINNNRDAIVYRYTLLGTSLGSGGARALSHEIGHWLGLPHTFGNTNNPGTVCGDDGVADTPVTKGNYNACGSASTNTNITCASNQTPYFQNIENIMDYSNCPRNFTQGQTNLMRNTLTLANVGRNNLVTASNLGSSFTDVNGSGNCRPIADYKSSTNIYTVCTGQSLLMNDLTYNYIGVLNSYQWASSNGATIASPTSSNTQITFNTAGITTVSLTVSNAQGSNTRVRTVTVINGVPSITGSSMQSFENTGLPGGWSVYTTPSNGLDWGQAFGVAIDGANSYSVEGASTVGGQITYLQMPTIDLLNNQNCGFKFSYAYARQSPTHNDIFRVQMSKDCGASWSNVLASNSTNLANLSGGISSSPYTPAANEWKIEDLTNYGPWSFFTNSPSVWIRFAFQEDAGGSGNNFYLDAINFSTPTGVNELTKSIGFNLFPNPSNGETNLKFRLSDPADINLNVVDLLGKEVLPVASSKLGVGEHNIVINKDNVLPKGVYFVNMTLNGAKMSRKFVVN